MPSVTDSIKIIGDGYIGTVIQITGNTQALFFHYSDNPEDQALVIIVESQSATQGVFPSIEFFSQFGTKDYHICSLFQIVGTEKFTLCRLIIIYLQVFDCCTHKGAHVIAISIHEITGTLAVGGNILYRRAVGNYGLSQFHGKNILCTGTKPAKTPPAKTRTDSNQIGTHLRDTAGYLGPATGSNRYNCDNCRNSDNDTKHGKKCPHFIAI